MTVLMLGKHPELGLYRAEYLRNHGYTVIFPETRHEAVAAVNAGGYDVVVLSYTLTDGTAIELRDLIEQSCPSCPVITLTEKRWFDQKIDSDKVVLVSEGPDALLEAIKSFDRMGEKGIRRLK
jgi:DNA-binding response OmpR family regulator